MPFSKPVIAFGILLLSTTLLVADQWRYVVPPANDDFANPPARILALSSEKPADLNEESQYRGKKQRYGQLIYGTGRTAPVAIVVDELNDGNFEFYVDRDRNRRILPDERMAGIDNVWRVPVPAVMADGEKTIEFPRTVYFRLSRTTRTLSAATCGFIEGRATIDEKEVAVRRVDGDCNGFFSDAQDRVWVNSTTDDRWDSITEQHLFLPILKIDGRKFALRADTRGERLELSPLVGFGNLKLDLPKHIVEKSVQEIHVTVQNRDGVLATLRNVNAAMECPAGDYRVTSLMITLNDPNGGMPWGYVFCDKSDGERRWHKLAHGEVLAINPIGKLEFAFQSPDEVKAGESFMVRPTLHTGDGLLIERAFRGEFQTFAGGCYAVTSILNNGTIVSSEASGFL